jgi:uncharacterized membrane protein
MKWQISDRARVTGLVALQGIGLLLAAALILPYIVQWHARDVQIYYESSAKLLQGQMPYRDFPLEYPPLALLAFVLPWLLAPGRALGYSSYAWQFLVLNVLWSTLLALVLARVAARRWPARSPARAVGVYTLLVLVSAPLLPWRYDLFPALLTLLALLCVLSGRPTLAGMWLGLGIAAKLYPIMLLPICAAYYLAGRSYRSLLRLILGSVIALGVVLLPYLLLDPGGWLSFLRYHQLRGLQLESLPAGAILLAHLLGFARVELVFIYGALQLVSPLADVAVLWQPIVFSLVSGVVFVSCWGRFRQEYATNGVIADASLIAYVVIALLAFIVTNKVFSAQYIIWLLPFVPLLRPRQIVALTILCGLTILLFPFLYAELLALQIAPVVLLNLRNALMVAVMCWLLAERLPDPVRSALTQRRRALWRRFVRQEEL